MSREVEALADTLYAIDSDLVDLSGPEAEAIARAILASDVLLAWADVWDHGYQRGLRDAEQDLQHGADNPYRGREAGR